MAAVYLLTLKTQIKPTSPADMEDAAVHRKLGTAICAALAQIR
jgi:hypothetical protein